MVCTKIKLILNLFASISSNIIGDVPPQRREEFMSNIFSIGLGCSTTLQIFGLLIISVTLVTLTYLTAKICIAVLLTAIQFRKVNVTANKDLVYSPSHLNNCDVA